MAFFETLGVPLKTERGNRVFPQSDCSFDISDALRRRMKQLRVAWVRDRAVSVETADGVVCAVNGEKERYEAQAVVIATGGVSYPGTGSTGDGYRMAQELGHTVVEPRGSLVPLESDDASCGKMQGLALKNVELRKAGNEYMDDALRQTEETIAKALEDVRETRMKFRTITGAQEQRRQEQLEETSPEPRKTPDIEV